MHCIRNTYRFRRRPPQSEVSVTLPNQTVELPILVKQLMNGESLNCGLALHDGNSSDFDEPDLRNMDWRHMSVSDVDQIIDRVTPKETLPIGE